jgi:hypothetical protein
MKLGVAYNVFDGEELLVPSVKRMPNGRRGNRRSIPDWKTGSTPPKGWHFNFPSSPIFGRQARA